MISTARIKVGDTLKLPVYPEHQPMEGKVICIHPQGRFFTVEFDTPYGVKVRESFPTEGPVLPDRQGVYLRKQAGILGSSCAEMKALQNL